MKLFPKFAIVALLFAAVPTARAAVHEADKDLEAFFQHVQPQEHSRKLLAGTDCLQHAALDAGVYVGSCGGLGVKDESHWCDLADVQNLQCTSANNYCGAGWILYTAAVAAIDALPSSTTSACVGQSEDDCCKPNGGAIAGVIIGCVAGLAAIITLFAFCCKCCCFRPKQVVVMQQQPAAAPQVVVVPAAK